MEVLFDLGGVSGPFGLASGASRGRQIEKS